MGSLQDRYLCPENGDRIEKADVPKMNLRLVELVNRITDCAKDAARFHLT